MCKRPYFKTAFGNQLVNEFQILPKLARHPYYPILTSIWDKLSWKKSGLARSEILRLSVNTLTVEYKYCGGNMQKFPQQLQTPLYHKVKTLSEVFIAFLKTKSNLKDFETIDESQS